jgi:hypothetical protein
MRRPARPAPRRSGLPANRRAQPSPTCAIPDQDEAVLWRVSEITLSLRLQVRALQPLRDCQRADGVRLRLLARLGDTADCGEVAVGTARLGEGCCQPGIVPDRLEDLDLTTARGGRRRRATPASALTICGSSSGQAFSRSRPSPIRSVQTGWGSRTGPKVGPQGCDPDLTVRRKSVVAAAFIALTHTAEAGPPRPAPDPGGSP